MSSYSERNEEIFTALRGRTIQDFAVEYQEKKLHILFTDGVVFSLWVDDEAAMCLDVDREARH